MTGLTYLSLKGACSNSPGFNTWTLIRILIGKLKYSLVFFNIMANFIPNEIKRIIPRNPPWIIKPLNTMLNRNNKFFKNYKRHGYKLEDNVRLDNIRKECQEAVENAKLTYLANMGKKLNKPNTSQKFYWQIIN